MLAHNWVYQTQWGVYQCEPLPFGSQASADSCKGCGLQIADRLLQRAYGGRQGDLGIKVVLDMIAGGVRAPAGPTDSLIIEGEYDVLDVGDTHSDDHVVIGNEHICGEISLFLGYGHIKRVRITVEVLEE